MLAVKTNPGLLLCCGGFEYVLCETDMHMALLVFGNGWHGYKAGEVLVSQAPISIQQPPWLRVHVKANPKST